MKYFRYPSKGPERADYVLPVALFALTVLSRLPFADPLLYNMDSGHFALALDRFDVALHQPHPPGYFLYVMMGRLARLVTGGDNSALIVVSIIFSGLSVSLIYSFGRRLYDRDTGIAAALMALTSPLLWFHGIVALSYAAECFLSLVIAWLCYRIINGERHLVWASAVLLGLAGGVRQTTIVFLLPLWLYSIRNIGTRRILLAMFVCMLSFGSWFLPMLHATGGYERYKEASDALFHRAVWGGITLKSVLNNARIQLFWLVWGLMGALIPAAMNLILRARTKAFARHPAIGSVFFVFWLAPSLLFYILVMSKEQNPGYGLVYMAGLYILAGRASTLEAERIVLMFPGRGFTGRRVLALMLAAVMSLNTLVFFFLKFNYSYWGVTQSRKLSTAYLNGLESNFPPDSTVVIGWEHIYVSYRHVAYYLPRYLVYNIPKIKTPGGGYYLSCMGRKTKAAIKLDIPEGTKQIVYFVPNTKGVGEKAEKLGARTLPLPGGFRMIYFEYEDLMKSGVPIDEALLDMGYDEDI